MLRNCYHNAINGKNNNSYKNKTANDDTSDHTTIGVLGRNIRILIETTIRSQNP